MRKFKFKCGKIPLYILFVFLLIPTFQNCSQNIFHSSAPAIATNAELSLLPPEDLKPQPTPTLRSFGAVGDGITDDTLAIQAAFNSDSAALDGENLNYAVRGSLRISRDLNISNMRFHQTMTYMPDRNLLALALRTLHVGLKKSTTPPTYIKVNFDNIFVNRGAEIDNGIGTYSAGIWLENAIGKFSNIEVTGNGRGFGILVMNSKDVELSNIHIHDMVYTSFNEPNGMDYAMASAGWNSMEITYVKHDGSTSRARIQEQIAGVFVTMSNNVSIKKIKIKDLLARFSNGMQLSYQSDGISVGRTHYASIEDAEISGVWEGVDFTGQNTENLILKNANFYDTFSFGVKFANSASRALIENVNVYRSGYAGFVVGGKANAEQTTPAPHDLNFVNCHAFETGSNGYWTNTPSGFLILNADLGNPFDITIKDSSAVNTKFQTMTYGYYVRFTDPSIKLINSTAEGFTDAATRGF